MLQKGLDGECYSFIHVKQSHNSTKQFQVVKSRDEKRCLSVNRQRKDVMPHQQRNCQCEDNLNQKNCECQPEQVEKDKVSCLTLLHVFINVKLSPESCKLYIGFTIGSLFILNNRFAMRRQLPMCPISSAVF